MRKPLALTLAGALLIAAPLLSGCSMLTSVPSDFPGDVPLIDGEVVLGITVPGDNDEKAWNVTIKVPGPDAFDTIKGQLTDAGYEYRGLTSGESGSSGAFTKDPYTVLVVVGAADGDEWNANYTVTDASTSE